MYISCMTIYPQSRRHSGTMLHMGWCSIVTISSMSAQAATAQRYADSEGDHFNPGMRYAGSLGESLRDFQKSGALVSTPNCGALVKRMATRRTRQFKDTAEVQPRFVETSIWARLIFSQKSLHSRSSQTRSPPHIHGSFQKSGSLI